MFSNVLLKPVIFKKLLYLYLVYWSSCSKALNLALITPILIIPSLIFHFCYLWCIPVFEILVGIPWQHQHVPCWFSHIFCSDCARRLEKSIKEIRSVRSQRKAAEVILPFPQAIGDNYRRNGSKRAPSVGAAGGAEWLTSWLTDRINNRYAHHRYPCRLKARITTTHNGRHAYRSSEIRLLSLRVGFGWVKFQRTVQPARIDG